MSHERLQVEEGAGVISPGGERVHPRTKVLSVQTPLLGNRMFAESLRRAYAQSDVVEFDAHWSTEQLDIHADGPLERQLQRVFLKRTPRPWVRYTNLDFFSLRYELGTSYWARRTLDDLLRTRRPDVLHMHTQALALLSLDVLRRFPTVISADMTSTLVALDTANPWRWTHLPAHVLERRTFRAATRIVTFSHRVAAEITGTYGIPPARIHVLHPGVDLEAFAALARDGPPRRERAETRLLFVGGDFDRKGGAKLTDVFLRRFGEREDVWLDIVSPEARVTAHPRIRVHRDIKPYTPAWRRLYAESDIFAMPTRREPYGFVYLEAMAAGLAVVGASVGAASELVSEGETGFLVDPNDVGALEAQLVRLVDDPPLRRAFGRAGQRRVAERFDARRGHAELEALFADVAKEVPPRSRR